ncbi:hypothetical protein OAK63_00895, partial [bacterium]|nr:hypothetical protein [bacterium]
VGEFHRLVGEQTNPSVNEVFSENAADVPAIMVAMDCKRSESWAKVLQFIAEWRKSAWVFRNKVTDQHDKVDALRVDFLNGSSNQVIVAKVIMMKVSHHCDAKTIEAAMSLLQRYLLFCDRYQSLFNQTPVAKAG